VCEADGRMSAGSAPGSVAEALRTAVACLDYLIPVAPELPAAACGEVLTTLGEVRSKLAAAHAIVLRRFDALDGHDADGYGSSSAWLAAMTKMTRKDAKASVKQMRTLGERPHLADAMANNDVSDSWAAEIAKWLKKLPEELRDGTEKILADAAVAGASLEDLATITAHALRQWQADHPDPDDDGDFRDRQVSIGTTFGGAAVIRGDLTPECAAAVTAVLEALGKKAGPEDDRTEKQRFHDALQLACELLLRAKLVPDRAGADTKVVAHISLRDLRAMPGASGLEDAWIRSILGESGYLTGADAEAAACDAMIVPIVAGTMDATILDTMIDLVLGAFGHHGPSADRQPDPGSHPSGGGLDDGGHHGQRPGREAHRDQAEHLAMDAESAFAASSPTAAAAFAAGRSGPEQMSPQAWQALRSALARLAVDLVSGPAGVASILRRGLLEHPWSTPSVPLDIGYSKSIPASIRSAVLWRDKYKCAWPRCGRPAAWCDVHHIEHKRDGGKTSVKTCITLCQFHHDTCVHRWGWRIVLHPDGTTSVYGPNGQVQHSDSRPPPGVPSG
jgi:Domain of unknown function (DUF222)